jgi:hypothetical protein
MTADSHSSSFGWFRYLDIECSMRKRFLKTECQRVLLANDADPSLMMDVGDGRSESQFAYELSVCSLVSLLSRWCNTACG